MAVELVVALIRSVASSTVPENILGGNDQQQKRKATILKINSNFNSCSENEFVTRIKARALRFIMNSCERECLVTILTAIQYGK